jgi:molybdate transport system regulatory protein
MQKNSAPNIEGSLFFNMDAKSFIGHGRIDLLERIDRFGSISKAAKSIKMSYKAAWDAVDAMNNIAKEPIVERETGGKGGGGTRLTPFGRELIAAFKQAEEEHRTFLLNLTQKIKNFDDHYLFFQRMTMRTSARNQYSGVISQINRGSINAEVGIKISPETVIYASITNESLKELELEEGMAAFALIKSGWVTLIGEECGKVSARNRLCGEVAAMNTGAINSEVTITLDAKNSITATITNASAKEMALHLGSRVCAIFKSNSVIVGV